MSDPAGEAAQRAWGDHSTIDPLCNADHELLVAAAREALKPIREKCQELNAMFGDAATDVAAGVRLVLTQIAPLIFTSEELEL